MVIITQKLSCKANYKSPHFLVMGVGAYNIMIIMCHFKCNLAYDVSHFLNLNHYNASAWVGRSIGR
jgi:hypothetical protein